jgi:hypothetical protein
VTAVIPAAPARRRRRWPWVVAALAVLGAGTAAIALTTGGNDDDSAASTTVEPPFVAVELCVRSDIASAALRAEPRRASELLATIPAGTCSVLAVDRVRGEDGPVWFAVEWNGLTGYSAQPNFLAPSERPSGTEASSTTASTAATTAATTTTAADAAADPLQAVIAEYYAAVADEDYDTMWNLLSADAQDGFGDFDSVVEIFARLQQVEIVRFDGCNAPEPPADCRFLTHFHNDKGGISEILVVLSMIEEGGAVKIDATPVFERQRCVQLNPGETDCSAG